MGKKYAVESEFEDLHGNPADDDVELDVDLSDSENPIIKAAFGGEDENWKPPAKDDDEDEEENEDSDDEDEDELEDEEEDEDEDSDEEEDEDEDSEDDDEEEDRYSKRVTKRIEREQNLRRQSDQKVARLEKRLELRDAKDDFRDEKAKLDKKLADLRKKKAEAIDEGDTAAQVDIDEEILDIKTEIRTGQTKIEKLQEALDNDDFDDVGGDTPPAGQKWLEKYPEFHSNAKFRNAVLLADKTVAGLGLDKNTNEYYEKIEEIVGVTFPKIVKTRNVKTTVKRKRKKTPAVGGTKKAGTRRTSKTRRRRGVVRLTKADQANMRTFGMDPDNPKHVKAYAESKED